MNNPTLSVVSIFTDGCYLPNSHVGGWACHFGWHTNGRYHACELVGSINDAVSSEQMEIMAIVKALAALDRPCRVTLYSDSKQVITQLGGKISWISSASWPKWAWKNKALVNQLMTLLRIHTVNFRWIKGHSKSQGNRRCDRLAGMSAESRMLRMSRVERKPKPPVISADGYYCCRHYQCVGKHDKSCPNYKPAPLAPVAGLNPAPMPVWQL